VKEGGQITAEWNNAEIYPVFSTSRDSRVRKIQVQRKIINFKIKMFILRNMKGRYEMEN
jgi:hypothetical protein